MDSIKLYIYSFVLFNVVIQAILFWKKGSRILCYRILSVYLVFICALLISFLGLDRNFILAHPHLFRTASPLVNLIPPMGYLFFYYLVHPNKKFNYYFLLFFLPFVVQVAELSTFYFQPVSEKLKEIQLVLAKDDIFYYSPQYIWFNPLGLMYFKLLLFFIFSALIGNEYFKFLFQTFRLKDIWTSKFLLFLSGIVFFRSVSVIYLFFRYFVFYSASSEVGSLGLFISADMIFVMIFLLWNPTFFTHDFIFTNLDPLRLQKENSGATEQQDEQGGKLPMHLEHIFAKVESYLSTNPSFLETNFSIEKMAHDLKMPQRYISFAIKKKTGDSVVHYINLKRLECLVQRYVSEDALASMKIDDLGELVGFNSRQTLYALCARDYQCSPRELLDQKKTKFLQNRSQKVL